MGGFLYDLLRDELPEFVYRLDEGGTGMPSCGPVFPNPVGNP